MGERKEAYSKLPKNKPWLILLPTELIQQWAEELATLSEHIELFLYHGTSLTDPKDGDGKIINLKVTKFGTHLTRKSPQLHPKSHAKVRVILTTKDTFQLRHGPSAQKTWLRDERNIKNPKERDRLVQNADEKWPGNLSGCFEGVIFDEAPGLKNAEALCNIAIRYLCAKHVLLATATPLWTGPDDTLGYLAVLESQEVKDAHLRALAKYGTKQKSHTHESNPFNASYTASDKALRIVSAGSLSNTSSATRRSRPPKLAMVSQKYFARYSSDTATTALAHPTPIIPLQSICRSAIDTLST